LWGFYPQPPLGADWRANPHLLRWVKGRSPLAGVQRAEPFAKKIFNRGMCYNDSHMRNLLYVAVIILAIALLKGPLSVQAFGPPGACGTDCKSCHKLKPEEAQAIVNSFNPGIKVTSVRPAEVGGLWEVSISVNGKKGLTYIDYSKGHILDGRILDVKTKKSLTDDRIAELNKVDVSKIPVKDAILLGSAGAPLKVIVFDDPV
jgi:thiol:disulfide interchange protein DsbC